MTLGEALRRSKTPPGIGDHEIVLDEEGVAHLLYITFVDPNNPWSFGFMCPCMKFKGGLDPKDLVVAPIVTCLECVTR